MAEVVVVDTRPMWSLQCIPEGGFQLGFCSCCHGYCSFSQVRVAILWTQLAESVPFIVVGLLRHCSILSNLLSVILCKDANIDLAKQDRRYISRLLIDF